ncbi:MAG: hypothetical protein U9O86_08955, partial [Campylobacterota bacterium]|nr:hypothetical protein [Campylobacterota bacterium]
ININRCKDKTLCEMKKLFRVLKKQGVVKEASQSMDDFLTQTEDKVEVDLKELNRLYHLLKYKEVFDPALFVAFKEEIRKVIKKI